MEGLRNRYPNKITKYISNKEIYQLPKVFSHFNENEAYFMRLKYNQ